MFRQALVGVALLGGSVAGCRSVSTESGQRTGSVCEEGQQCASGYCLETRVATERVCCVRACDDGAVCQVDGRGCEFASRTPSLADESPQATTAAASTTEPIASATASTASLGSNVSTAAVANAGAGGTGEPDASNTCPPDAAGGIAQIACDETEASDTSPPTLDASTGAIDIAASADGGTSSTPQELGSTTQSDPLTDAGSQPSAAPTLAALPPVCNGELLANGDFEAGESGWLAESTWPGAHAIVSAQDTALQAEGVLPQAGDHLAWLGGIPDTEFDGNEVSISQPFNVPEDVAVLEFAGYVRIATLEPEQDAAYDGAFIDVLSATEKVLWIPHIWSNQDATDGWVAFTYSVSDERLDAMRGKSLTLKIHSETDPDMKTSFWLDSLSMTAQCGR